MKLRCDLNAEYAKRIRFSSNTGEPHFKASVAFGATFLRIARISRSFFCASFEAEAIYSSTLAGLDFGMSSILANPTNSTKFAISHLIIIVQELMLHASRFRERWSDTTDYESTICSTTPIEISCATELTP